MLMSTVVPLSVGYINEPVHSSSNSPYILAKRLLVEGTYQRQSVSMNRSRESARIVSLQQPIFDDVMCFYVLHSKIHIGMEE